MTFVMKRTIVEMHEHVSCFWRSCGILILPSQSLLSHLALGEPHVSERGGIINAERCFSKV